MSFEKLACHCCDSVIISYFNENYGGLRGKCPSCNNEFPLE
jgi:hypothetical protein